LLRITAKISSGQNAGWGASCALLLDGHFLVFTAAKSLEPILE